MNIAISQLKKDEHGVWRDGPVRDADEAELASIEYLTDWQGAYDLPEGVEFCEALTESGDRVRLYRGDSV